jgi:ubiquinone biosynthesis protein UbiJ
MSTTTEAQPAESVGLQVRLIRLAIEQERQRLYRCVGVVDVVAEALGEQHDSAPQALSLAAENLYDINDKLDKVCLRLDRLEKLTAQ